MGIVGKDGAHSESKGDFAIKLEALIEAGSKTGYLATIKQAIDEEQRSEMGYLKNGLPCTCMCQFCTGFMC